MDIWVIPKWEFWAIIDIAITDIVVHGMSIFLLDAHRGMEWLGHSVCIYSAAKLFPQSVLSLYTPVEHLRVLLVISSPSLDTARPSNFNVK